MTSAKSQIVKALQDKEYRQLYVDENISTVIAVQLREMRESKGWTQSELGQHASGIRQERISQLEDPDYGRPTLTTLKRLAAAFDVALIVRFAPFSELVNWSVNLTPAHLNPQDFAHDRLLTSHESNIIVFGGASIVFSGALTLPPEYAATSGRTVAAPVADGGSTRDHAVAAVA